MPVLSDAKGREDCCNGVGNTTWMQIRLEHFTALLLLVGCCEAFFAGAMIMITCSKSAVQNWLTGDSAGVEHTEVLV